jgi:DNA-nicking Smr family endonuclease
MRDVRRIVPPPAEDNPAPHPVRVKPAPPTAAAKPAPKRPSPQPVALPQFLDSETTRRLKTRALRPQARLDLHGMTEAAAHAALTGFVHECAHLGHHLVLVITGKGLRGQGALKRNLPLWIEGPALRRHVAAVAPAFIPDGGGGAYYIKLRRN